MSRADRRSATPQISAEISVYPLRQAELGPMVELAVRALRECGLEPQVGRMSTYVTGDADSVFLALKTAFKLLSERGDVVMSTTISNACPI